MTSKDKRRRDTITPVTTTEEIPSSSPNEREQLLRALQRAESRIKAGKGIDHDSKTFKQRLLHIHRDGRP